MDSQDQPGSGGVGEATADDRPSEASLPPVAPPLPGDAGWVQPPPPKTVPPARRRSRTRGFVIGVVIVVALVLGAMGGAAAFINASLSATYNPEKAVSDYFAAQKRGDAKGMFANGTFLRGDGSFTEYFDANAVQQMLKTTENTDISEVKIVSSKAVDSSTQLVDVSMTWHGKAYSPSYTVVKDTTRVHFFLYYSWRIEIPFSTIAVNLPNQPGPVGVDGLLLPPQAGPSGIQVIQGFHTVTMYANYAYDNNSLVVNGVDPRPAITFPSKVSAAATAAAGSAIKIAFSPGHCDAAKYSQCNGHVYSAPSDPRYIWSWNIPGYGYIDYTTYVYDLVGDPTVVMKLVVTSDPGKLTASGTCKYRITIDTTKGYNLQGDYTATLTWSGGAFTADVLENCAKEPAS